MITCRTRMIFTQALLSIMAVGATVNGTKNVSKSETDLVLSEGKDNNLNLKIFSDEDGSNSSLKIGDEVSNSQLTNSTNKVLQLDVNRKPIENNKSDVIKEIQEVVADRSHEYGVDSSGPYPRPPKLPHPPPLPPHYQTLEDHNGQDALGKFSSYSDKLKKYSHDKGLEENNRDYHDDKDNSHNEEHSYGKTIKHKEDHDKGESYHDKGSDHKHLDLKSHDKKEDHDLGFREYSHTHYYEKEENFDHGFHNKDDAHDDYNSKKDLKGNNRYENNHKGHGYGHKPKEYDNSYGVHSKDEIDSSEYSNKNKGHLKSNNGYKKGHKRVKGYIITTNREYFKKGSKEDKGYEKHESKSNNHDKGHNSHDKGHLTHDEEEHKYDSISSHNKDSKTSHSGYKKGHEKKDGLDHYKHGEESFNSHGDDDHGHRYSSHDDPYHGGDQYDSRDHLPRPSIVENHRSSANPPERGINEDNFRDPPGEASFHAADEFKPERLPNDNRPGHATKSIPRTPYSGPSSGIKEVNGPRSYVPKKRFRPNKHLPPPKTRPGYPRRGPLLRLRYKPYNPKIESGWSPQILAKH